MDELKKEQQIELKLAKKKSENYEKLEEKFKVKLLLQRWAFQSRLESKVSAFEDQIENLREQIEFYEEKGEEVPLSPPLKAQILKRATSVNIDNMLGGDGSNISNYVTADSMQEMKSKYRMFREKSEELQVKNINLSAQVKRLEAQIEDLQEELGEKGEVIYILKEQNDSVCHENKDICAKLDSGENLLQSQKELLQCLEVEKEMMIKELKKSNRKH